MNAALRLTLSTTSQSSVFASRNDERMFVPEIEKKKDAERKEHITEWN
jgi:hypothetical protein